MSNKILVAYATKCGSTIEVARAIGDTIARNGATVDVKPIKEITDINEYDAFIVGSAIRMAQWLPEAKDFVKSHQIHLNEKSTAIFSVHILNQGDNPDDRRERQAYTTQLKEFLTPKAEAFFPGKIDQAQLSFFECLIFKMVKSPEGDYRNWDAIREWAAGLVM